MEACIIARCSSLGRKNNITHFLELPNADVYYYYYFGISLLFQVDAWHIMALEDQRSVVDQV